MSTTADDMTADEFAELATQRPPVDAGDLTAAHLRASVREDDDGVLCLRLDDKETAIHIDAEYGSLEQQILGIERAISGLQEFRAALKRQAEAE